MPHDPLRLAIPLLSFARSRQSYPSLGTLHLNPTQIFALPIEPVQQGSPGMKPMNLQVPDDPSLRGLPAYCHALFIGFTSGQQGLSNLLIDVIR